MIRKKINYEETGAMDWLKEVQQQLFARFYQEMKKIILKSELKANIFLLQQNIRQINNCDNQ